MRKLVLLLLVTGLSLVLAAGGGALYRFRNSWPPAPATQALMDATADPEAPAREATPSSDPAPPPVVSHGAEGLGASDGFACAVESGARRCRSPD